MKRYKPPYYAFISYCGSDEKWAKWLHKKLEYCHIPTELCKEHPSLPKKIRPVFWYKQDLSGTKLRKALHSELNESKYLIVICSPESANAFWVNDEVQTFIAQGKGDKIIPLIVSGTPHSPNPKEECFPKALKELSKEEEIRGIDVHRKEGKMHALIDVITTMFNIRFDELWQRHKRYQKRKRINIGCLIILFLSILLALSVYFKKIQNENRKKIIDNVTNLTHKALAQGDIRLAKLIVLDFTQKYSKNLSTKENIQIEGLVRRVDIQEQMTSYVLLAYDKYDIIDSKYSENGDTIYIYDRVGYDKAICSLWSDANGKSLGNKEVSIFEKKTSFKSSNYEILLKEKNITIYNKLGKLVYRVPLKFDIERFFFDEDRLLFYMVYNNSKKTMVEYNLRTNKECVMLELGAENECLNIFCDKRKKIYIATSKSGIGVYNTETKTTENFMTIPLLTSVNKSPIKDEIIVTTKNCAYQISLSDKHNLIKMASKHSCNYLMKIDIDYSGNLMLIKKLNLTRLKNGKLKGLPCVEIWNLKTKQLIHSLNLNNFTENNFHNVQVQIISDKNILLIYKNLLEAINLENGTKRCVSIEESLIYRTQLLKYRQEVLVNYKYLYDCKHLQLLKRYLIPYKATYNIQKTMFAYKDEGVVRIIDSSKKTQAEWKYNIENRLSNLVISNDNLYLADFGEGNLCIWNLNNKKISSVSQLSKSYKEIQNFGSYYLAKGDDHFAIIDENSGQIIYEHTANVPEFFAASENGNCIVLVEGNYGVEKSILAIKIKIENVDRILHIWKKTLKGRVISNEEISRLQNF